MCVHDLVVVGTYGTFTHLLKAYGLVFAVDTYGTFTHLLKA